MGSSDFPLSAQRLWGRRRPTTRKRLRGTLLSRGLPHRNESAFFDLLADRRQVASLQGRAMRPCRRGSWARWERRRDETKRGGRRQASGDFAHLRAGRPNRKKEGCISRLGVPIRGQATMLPISATSGCGRVARPHEMAGLPRFLLCRRVCGLPWLPWPSLATNTILFAYARKRTPKLKSKRREDGRRAICLPYQARYTTFGTISTLAKAGLGPKTSRKPIFGLPPATKSKSPRNFNALPCLTWLVFPA